MKNTRTPQRTQSFQCLFIAGCGSSSSFLLTECALEFIHRQKTQERKIAAIAIQIVTVLTLRYELGNTRNTFFR